MIELLTVGFQERSDGPGQRARNFEWRPFSALLVAAGVKVIVDTRRYPTANTYDRNPWCQKNLPRLLQALGIDYVEFKAGAPSSGLLKKEKYGVAAGDCNCRSQKRCAAEHLHVRKALAPEEFRLEYLLEIAATHALSDLSRMLEQRPEDRHALLCWEADPRKCHRSILAEALMNAEPGRYHVFDINARLADR